MNRLHIFSLGGIAGKEGSSNKFPEIELSSNFVLLSRLLQSNQAEVLINANG
jgi:hypothetical protein